MKERKLVLKEGQDAASIQQVLQTVQKHLEREFPKMEITVSDCRYACYVDTYYDTDEHILQKNGESFKIRKGSELGGKAANRVVMRRATKYPQKKEFAPWDEVEMPLIKMSFETAKRAMQPFFYEFNFEELNSAPVLSCTTHRTAFKITLHGEEENTFSIYFDNIKYNDGVNTEEDNIIKLSTRFDITGILKRVMKSLEKTYQQYEMVYLSRYERALQVLKNKAG